MKTDQKLQALFDDCQDYFVRQFMDIHNGKHTDWKIQVLQDLQNGKKPPEIAHYDDVLDREDQNGLNLDVQF